MFGLANENVINAFDYEKKSTYPSGSSTSFDAPSLVSSSSSGRLFSLTSTTTAERTIDKLPTESTIGEDGGRFSQEVLPHGVEEEPKFDKRVQSLSDNQQQFYFPPQSRVIKSQISHDPNSLHEHQMYRYGNIPAQNFKYKDLGELDDHYRQMQHKKSLIQKETDSGFITASDQNFRKNLRHQLSLENGQTGDSEKSHDSNLRTYKPTETQLKLANSSEFDEISNKLPPQNINTNSTTVITDSTKWHPETTNISLPPPGRVLTSTPVHAAAFGGSQGIGGSLQEALQSLWDSR